MLAKDIMVTDVVSVRPDTSVVDAAKLLIEKNISGVPVVNEHNGLIGIVSDADLIVRDSNLHIPAYLNILGSVIYLENPKILEDEVRKAAAVKVSDLMTTEVITVEEDTSVEEVATLMVEKKINRIPVLKNGKLIGLISRGDVVKSLVK